MLNRPDFGAKSITEDGRITYDGFIPAVEKKIEIKDLKDYEIEYGEK